MEFMTRNARMQELLALAKKVAASGETVLLQGESGTGKERLALYIHAHSARAKGQFVKIDCSTVPDALWESELFGYERGAFTGAKPEGKESRFEQAMGGTIFLDEIGEVSPPNQAKLLRVLQEKAFNPVGAVKSRKVDVRVIAATNRNLAELVAKGLFREDLYYRLNVFTMTLPPLRDRKEDLEPLTEEILAGILPPGGRLPLLTPRAIAALLLHRWPGNIRELENALKRAAVLVGAGVSIDADDLPPEVAENLAPGRPGQTGVSQTHRQYMKAAEILYLRWVLHSCGNDRTRAARQMGLSRAALYKKLNAYPELKSDLAPL